MSPPPDAYVTAALAAAHANYRAKNPVSAQVHEDACTDMPGGNTRTVLYAAPYPLVMASGAGSQLMSVDGQTYTDFLGEFSAGVFGHSHPAIATAVTGALATGWNFGAEHLLEKTLARKVTARFTTAGLELVRFTNSGTEANTTLIGAALAFTGRRKVLVFTNGYHGSTVLFPMALCQWMHSGAPGTPCPLKSMNLPHEFVVAPWNNRAETARIVAGLPPDSLAAILIEPVQGAGGCRPALPAFLEFLRVTATALGALLIADEVMSSRLGPAGALAALGLRADLVSLGKWIGGGMTFGAFGGRRDVMALFDPAQGAQGLMHPGTFNNNVVTMAAGAAGVDVFSPAAVAGLNALGDRLKDGMAAALATCGLYRGELAPWLADPIEVDSLEAGAGAAATRLFVGEDREPMPLPKVFMAGRGSMLNLRFAGADAMQWHGLYYHYMLDHGIYLASRGYTPLNLMLTEADVDRFVGVAKNFLMLHAEALK